MVRYIKGEEVEQILTLPKAIELIEQAFRDLAEGHAFDSARRRIRQPRGHLQASRAVFTARTVIPSLLDIVVQKLA